MFETQTKTVPITKAMVKAAYRKVKANHGAAGVDKESLEEYHADLLNNLYVLWNRLSSGSYFPKPLRSVSIPKTDGKQRVLGIPAVSDRIAQQVVKDYLEPRLEAAFSKHSYGYRPLKGTNQAIAAVQENVRQYAWVIDMDIKSFTTLAQVCSDGRCVIADLLPGYYLSSFLYLCNRDNTEPKLMAPG